MTVDAVRRASGLQALAMNQIHAQYRTIKDETDPFKMHLDQLLAEMEDAYANDTVEAMNEKYRKILEPFIQMAMTPQEQV